MSERRRAPIRLLGEEDFYSRVAAYFGVELSDQHINESLVSSVVTDALGLFRFGTLLEELAGHELPLDLDLQRLTLRGAYSLYARLRVSSSLGA